MTVKDLTSFGGTAIGIIGTTIITKEMLKLMRNLNSGMPKRRSRKIDFNLRF